MPRQSTELCCGLLYVDELEEDMAMLMHPHTDRHEVSFLGWRDWHSFIFGVPLYDVLLHKQCDFNFMFLAMGF